MYFIVNFFKMFVVYNLTFYSYFKVVNCKNITVLQVILNVIFSVIVAMLYAAMYDYLNVLTSVILGMLIYGVAFSFNINGRTKPFWLAYEFSFFLSYAVYMISVFMTSFAILLISGRKFVGDVQAMFFIVFFCLLIIFGLFKIKRLKNGVNFIKNFNGNKYTIFVLVLLFATILLLYDLFQRDFSTKLLRVAPFFVLIICVVFIVIIKKLIIKHYRNNIRDRNISIQKEEIDASEKIIGELKEQNLKLATTIHKYNHRLSALENSIRKVMDSSNTEFAKELTVVLEQTKKVKTQFAEETKVSVALPTTNVVAVDNMLEYMKNECEKCGIDFTVKLSDSIIPLLNKYISEDKFETLLGDHIKDAIIAINANHAGYKGIMVLIGIVDNAYELSVYDTGIEFEIPVLVNLGVSAITTHKDEGGTGLGFMTTFETLKSSKASLVIEEYDKRVTNYTKSVTIRFDGKCDYRVYSYRAEEIKEQCGRRNIVIKKI